MVKSACGIEAVYMCFNGTGIWGGETLTVNANCVLTTTEIILITFKNIFISTMIIT